MITVNISIYNVFEKNILYYVIDGLSQPHARIQAKILKGGTRDNFLCRGGKWLKQYVWEKYLTQIQYLNFSDGGVIWNPDPLLDPSMNLDRWYH